MKLRIPDEDLEIGDVAVHGEEAYPSDELVGVGAAGRPSWPRTDPGPHPGEGPTRGRLGQPVELALVIRPAAFPRHPQGKVAGRSPHQSPGKVRQNPGGSGEALRSASLCIMRLACPAGG